MLFGWGGGVACWQEWCVWTDRCDASQVSAGVVEGCVGL